MSYSVIYSRSQCCECAGADGLFESCNLTEKLFQTPAELLWKTLRFPKAEKVLLCVLLIFSDWAESKKEPWLRPPLHQTRPGRDRVLPEVFSPPYCFQYCCCVWCVGSNQGERRRCNWEALTEFNKGEGFNRRSRLLPRLFSVHRRGQKRSWGPKWMIIGVAMVCGW